MQPCIRLVETVIICPLKAWIDPGGAQMDLDRIRYLLASYFRTRLTKVRSDVSKALHFIVSELALCGAAPQIKASIFYLESEMGTIRPLLSAEERAFVQKYSKLKLDHFNHAVLDVAAISDHFRPLNDPAIGQLCGECIAGFTSPSVTGCFVIYLQLHHQICSSGCSVVF
jgi:hypothetical protein